VPPPEALPLAQELRQQPLLTALAWRTAPTPAVRDIRTAVPIQTTRRATDRPQRAWLDRPDGGPRPLVARVRPPTPPIDVSTPQIDPLAQRSDRAAAPSQAPLSAPVPQNDQEPASVRATPLPAAHAHLHREAPGNSTGPGSRTPRPAVEASAPSPIADPGATALDPSIAALPALARRAYAAHTPQPGAARLALLARVQRAYARPEQAAEVRHAARGAHDGRPGSSPPFQHQRAGASPAGEQPLLARPAPAAHRLRPGPAPASPRLSTHPARSHDHAGATPQAGGPLLARPAHEAATYHQGSVQTDREHHALAAQHPPGDHSIRPMDRAPGPPLAAPDSADAGQHMRSDAPAAPGIEEHPDVPAFPHASGRIGPPATPFGGLALRAPVRVRAGVAPRQAAPLLHASTARARLERLGWRFRADPQRADAPVELQRAQASGPALVAALAARRVARGEPLPERPRAALEQVLGVPFGDARIHTGAEAAALADALRADAVTIGDEIFFGAGKARFETAEGLALLGHELTHVAQARGVRPVPLPPRAPRRPTLAPEAPGDAQPDEGEALHVERTLRMLLAPPALWAPAGAPVAAPPGGARPAPPVGSALGSARPAAPAGIATAAADRTLGEHSAGAMPAPVGQQHQSPDLDALACQVYDRLRFRLLIEQERRG
jgi:hypothetical protein